MQDYLEALASDSPTPGGGSASALSGAMGAALVCMACRLTLGRKRFADFEAEIGDVLKRAEAVRQRLTALSVEDQEAFKEVMAAYRLPKADETQAATRRRAIHTALRRATTVPLEVASACSLVVAMANGIKAKVNGNVLSDLGSSALLAEAGLQAALLNVKTNLAGLADEGFSAEVRGQIGEMEKQARSDKEAVYQYCLRQMV